MTPEEALRNILTLVDGSDEMEDVHLCTYFCRALRLSQRRVWVAPHDASKFRVRAIALRGGISLRPASVRRQSDRAGQHH
jgi:hypothetical protein